MKAFKIILSLSIAIFLCGFAVSCGTGKPPAVILPLVVDPAPLPAAVINVPYSATLKATGGLPPFTWSIGSGTLPPGFSISADGVISGTPTTLGSTTFKVQVTDSQSPTAAIDLASKTITVNKPLAISTTSLTAGSVNVPYSASVVATGGVPPYTWMITSGSLPAGLTLSTGGIISGTPTAEGTSTLTAQVSDSQSTPATASVNLSLTINGPTSRLNGKYVFYMEGYAKGAFVLDAGTFTADGQGNITNGLMDLAGGPTSVPFSGNYSLDSTNTGPMHLIVPSLSFVLDFTVAVPASGTIRLIQNGGAGAQGTGVIRKVLSSTPITISSLAAFWTFGASGQDAASSRYGAAGTFQSATTGTWTSGVQDTNDNGVVATSVAFTGSFVAIDPVTGRGTATLTVTGGATTNYSFYPVSRSELIMLSTDPVSSTAPLALFSLATRVNNAYTNASLNTTTVAELQGVSLSSSTAVPDVLLGFATFDGAGKLTVSTDENLGGTLSANNYTGTYNVESNGRTTLTGFSSSPIVFYLSSSIGFTLKEDASVATGTVVPQFGSPYTNASISGSYQGASIEAVLSTVTVEADSATPDGNGNFPLYYDISGPGGPQTGLTQAATYSVDSTGRAPLTSNGNTTGIAYVVNPSKIMVLSTDANPKVNSLEH
jgi:hypothetical protein